MNEPEHQVVDLDALDLDALRARGSLKWSGVAPDGLSAWVTEMDFATAPVIRRALADAVEREQFGYPVDDDVGTAVTGTAVSGVVSVVVAST